MNHTNGGLAIRKTFGRFAGQNFGLNQAATACEWISLRIEAGAAEIPVLLELRKTISTLPLARRP